MKEEELNTQAPVLASAVRPQVKVLIDGQQLKCDASTSIIEAAAQLGIKIPTLCYLKGYPTQSSCSLCLVELEGTGRLVLACSTPVAAGMSVLTESIAVAEARRTCLELLFSDHAGSCVGNCTNACPADLAVSGFLDQVENGNDRDALQIIHDALSLPAVLGRVCPGYCESACLRKRVDKPISIRALHGELAEVDLAREEPQLPSIAPAVGKRVAIVGAGPTGLSAAFYLLRQGYDCVLYDANERAGGLLRYGMNEELLPRSVLDAELGLIERMGAVFKQNWRLGVDGHLEELRAEYVAVVLALGATNDWTSEHRTVAPEVLARLGLDAPGAIDKRTGATSIEGVFAAGEFVFGASKTVRAVAAGRAAAAVVHEWLETGEARWGSKPFMFRSVMTPEEQEAFFNPETDEVGTAAGGLANEPQAAAGAPAPATSSELRQLGVRTKSEARRCLDCTCVSYDNCDLRIYAARYGVNEKRFSGVRRTLATDRSHPEIDYEPGKCILCGLCIVVAQEAGESMGLGFAGRGFDVRLTLPFGESFAKGLGKAARRCAEVCPVGAITIKQKTR